MEEKPEIREEKNRKATMEDVEAFAKVVSWTTLVETTVSCCIDSISHLPLILLISESFLSQDDKAPRRKITRTNFIEVFISQTDSIIISKIRIMSAAVFLISR